MSNTQDPWWHEGRELSARGTVAQEALQDEPPVEQVAAVQAEEPFDLETHEAAWRTMVTVEQCGEFGARLVPLLFEEVRRLRGLKTGLWET